MPDPEPVPAPEPAVPDPTPAQQPAAETPPAEPPRVIAVLGEIQFAGAALAGILQSKGFAVRVLCPDDRAAAALPPGTVDVVRGNLDSPDAIEQALRGAYGAAFLSPITLKGRMYRAAEHLEDVRRVVEAVRKVDLKCFVYHSSVSAHPNSPTRALSQAAEAEGVVSSLKCHVFRLRTSMLMGKGDGFLSELVEAAQGPALFMGIWGYGGTMVQPVHVNDMASCIARLFEDPDIASSVVNVAGPELTTPLELIDSVLQRLGRVKLKFHAPLFILKLLTSMGSSAEFKEKVNLLLEAFYTDQNDSVKLLGSARKLVTPRQSQEEILSASS
jgi:NADH dehydrogenase